MTEKTICSLCGTKLTDKTATDFDGKIFCDECLREKTTICDCCGERIYRDEAQGDDFTTLCDNCYEYSYTHCENCGTLIHNNDAHYEDDSDYPYCAECFAKLQESAIKSYNYKPEPIFYGSGNFFMGIELEIDKGGEENENAEVLLNIANRHKEHIYCKHDGSIDKNDANKIPFSLPTMSEKSTAISIETVSHIILKILEISNTSSCFKIYEYDGFFFMLPDCINLDMPHRKIHITNNGIVDNYTQGDIPHTSKYPKYGDSWFSKEAHNNMQVLKREYRELVKKYHPDICANAEASAIFSAIHNEYESINS